MPRRDQQPRPLRNGARVNVVDLNVQRVSQRLFEVTQGGQAPMSATPVSFGIMCFDLVRCDDFRVVMPCEALSRKGWYGQWARMQR